MLIGRALVDGRAVDVRWSPDGPVPISVPDDGDDIACGGHDTAGPRADAELIAPAAPVVLVGIAQNGPHHPAPVQAWLKSPRTIVPSGRTVRLRRDAGQSVAEGEIAVVIGRDCTELTAATAERFVRGVTAVNDLSSPDRTVIDVRNFESKSGVGYTPLGPWIDTAADIDRVALGLEIDGAVVAQTDAAALPVSIRDCLAYVASWTPLGPGDVVMTGAPFSAAAVQPGHRIDVIVGGVRLTTPTS
ncbi:fumarylacetoacetate hydrolase family protein [uncultured Microbacterium sp.]|uniref:fumarylacetoacetate hydrolase family protein n=1 Tax=uncultured Microbacterium sp. TaxID=191216 RepID=UPI0025DE1900|nr:fumarylacetoacetate hydrolase family protein [uncultured Microbacterium sp.]